MIIIRFTVILVCAILLFVMAKWHSSEKAKNAPKKAVLLFTKSINLICAALIAISVFGQIIDLTSK